MADVGARHGAETALPSLATLVLLTAPGRPGPVAPSTLPGHTSAVRQGGGSGGAEHSSLLGIKSNKIYKHGSLAIKHL